MKFLGVTVRVLGAAVVSEALQVAAAVRTGVKDALVVKK